MTYKAVLFDLDGTLLDTLDDLAAATNRVLAAKGFAIHPHDAYRWFIGDGSAVLMERALPESARTPEMIQTCLKALLDDYGQNWHVVTRPYDGILELLDTLETRNIRMGIITNKPHPFTLLTIDYYLSHVTFNPILGQRDGIPKKPDPQQALSAAQIMGVQPADCIFIGDSAVDMFTARNAGMTGVGAAWGFRPEQELREAGAHQVIQHPLMLLDIVRSRS